MSVIEENTRQAAVKAACATRMNLIEFQYEWTIFNFSLCRKTKGEFLLSPTFTMGSRDQYKWQLKVFPCGSKHLLRNELGLSAQLINLERGDKADVRTKCTFFISNDKMKMPTVPPITIINEGCLTVSADRIVKEEFLSDPVNRLLPNDSLTLVCEITIIEDVITENTYLHKVPKCQLLDDLKDLFKSSKLYDVTLIACGREFRAHKAILAARSSVFLAMFENEMMEQKENRVDITDVDGDVLNEMLRFIYTGETMNLDKMAEGLLAAANKYQLEGLKSLCTKELCKNLSIENASTLLILADLICAVELKTYVQNFIFTHRNEMSKTESFKSICNTPAHLHLIMEALVTYR